MERNRQGIWVVVALAMLVGEVSARTVFVSSEVTSAPNIDGVLSAGEWGSGYTVTMNRYDDGGQHDSVLWFQHDATNLYIGVDSGWGTGWDVYWRLLLDGDNSHSPTGSISEPHIDSSYRYPGPGGWGGYNTFWAYTAEEPSGVQVSNPAGALRASAGSSNVTYEFQIPFSDLGITTGDSIGFGTFHRLRWPVRPHLRFRHSHRPI